MHFEGIALHDKITLAFFIYRNTALIKIIQNENDLVEVVTQNTINSKIFSFKSKRIISSIPFVSLFLIFVLIDS